MPNPIQYSLSTPLSGSLRKGNVIVGINDLNYGPTSTTGWYNAPELSPGTYQVIQVSSSGDPEVFCPQSDAELITFVKGKGATGTNTGSAVEALAWIGTQTGLMAVNNNFPNIVTNGMIFNWDAKMASSYPGTGSVFYTNAFSGSNSADLLNNPSYKKEGWIDFDGTDDYFTINQYSPNFPGRLGFTNSFTFCFVVKFPAMGSGAFDPILFGFDAVSGAQFNYYRNNGWPTNYMGWLAYSTSGYQNEWAYYEPGRFYQIAVSLAADGTYLALHNNTTNKSGQFANFDRWYVNQNEISGPGRGLGGGAYSFGSLRLYNRGLTRAEMLQNFYLGPIVTGSLIFTVDAGNLPSYYSGSTTTWSLTGSLTGTLINGVTYNNGNLGSWVFDGNNDYIETGDTILSSNTSYTMCAWAKSSTSGFQNRLMGNADATGGLSGTDIIWGANTANRIFVVRRNGSNDSSRDMISSDIPNLLTTWHHIAVTYDHTGVGSILYVDGIQVATNTTLGFTCSLPFRIGRDGNGTDAFNGNVYNVQLYNRALTSAEVIQNYNAHKGRFGL